MAPTATDCVIIEAAVDEKSYGHPPIDLFSMEPLDARVRVYPLEKIVAQKLRAILQHIKNLKSGDGAARAADEDDLSGESGGLSKRNESDGFLSHLHEKLCGTECGLRDRGGFSSRRRRWPMLKRHGNNGWAHRCQACHRSPPSSMNFGPKINMSSEELDRATVECSPLSSQAVGHQLREN